MSFDGLMFQRVAQLLQEKLLNSRINKINQISSTDFVFSLYKGYDHYNFVVVTNNAAPFMTITNQVYKDFIFPTHFTNLLRKHLENGEIISIRQINYDRIIEIVVNKMDELGDFHKKYLFIELTGKMTNIIFAKEDLSILDALHRFGPSETTKRTLMAGALYRFPPTYNYTNPLEVKLTMDLSISSQCPQIGKTLEKEVTYRLFHGGSFVAIINEILSSSTLYLYHDDYFLIPLQSRDENYQITPWNEGLIQFHQKKIQEKQKMELAKDLEKVIKAELKHNTTKLANLNKDLDNSNASMKYRHYGNLLYAYVEDLHQILSSIKVHDLETDEDVVIPLDNTIDIRKNASHFYNRYQKMQKSFDVLKQQIEITKSEINYFESLAFQLEDGDKNDIEQIHIELESLGYLKSLHPSKPSKVSQKFLPKEFIAPDGTKVYVGKNNLQNDYLTLKIAKYTDTFFHVKEYAGSHVIVQGDCNLESTIRFAANLAAYFSKARFSSSVPVDYCLVKNVKKPSGAKPGLVNIRNYKTIYIDPEKPNE